MNARIKKLWVAALRSGKWRKAKGMLRKTTNYRCCLGVLDEVYMEDTGRGKWDEGKFVCDEGFQRNDKALTLEVIEWAGLNHPQGGSVNIGGETASLTIHNDGIEGTRPKTQLEIADAIEEQL